MGGVVGGSGLVVVLVSAAVAVVSAMALISGTHKPLTATVGSVPREVGRISAAGTKREDDGDGGRSVSLVVRSQLGVVVAFTQ